MTPKTILVIRLGALGDILQFFGAFQTIRAAHPDATIDALTLPPYAALFEGSGLFDAVHAPPKPKGPAAWLRLVSTLRRRRYDRVYDLQRNDRTAFLFRAMRLGRPLDWSGVVRGCSHYTPGLWESDAHAIDKIAIQMRDAGLPTPARSDLSFLDGAVDDLAPPTPFAIIAPATAPSRPRKRWPADRYAEIARRLFAQGVSSAVVGGPGDQAVCAQAAASGALDLCGRTDFGQLAALGRRAAAALGGDTGPMHLLSLVGCPVLSLYGEDSDPERTKPLGPAVDILRDETMAALNVERVWTRLSALLDQSEMRAGGVGPCPTP